MTKIDKRLEGKDPTGKLAFVKALIGSPQHDVMMRLNNCISGDCLNCHWFVFWRCYRKLQNHILKMAQMKIYNYLKNKTNEN